IIEAISGLDRGISVEIALSRGLSSFFAFTEGMGDTRIPATLSSQIVSPFLRLSRSLVLYLPFMGNSQKLPSITSVCFYRRIPVASVTILDQTYTLPAIRTEQFD